MTDDFQLFGDPDDGVGAINPDIALITAYLARELSPMQVLALEERLATDAAFRSEMQALIDAWAAPVPSLEGGLAHRPEPLSSIERAESWRRFQAEEPSVLSVEPVALDAEPRTIRSFPMKRIALLTAAIALPVVSFAQVIVYAANHSGFPGHTFARQVVSAFTHEPIVGRRVDADIHRLSRSSEITDSPVNRPLTTTTAAPAESLRAPAPVVPTRTPVLAPAQQGIPDRALIAELTRQYQPRVARGDTSVDYVVIVLDSAEKYVWSTIGGGNLSIQVGGGSVERGRGGISALRGDSVVGIAGRGLSGPMRSRIFTGDTVYTLQYDSLNKRIAGSVRSGRGRGRFSAVASDDSLERGLAGRLGRGGFPSTYSKIRADAYLVGWVDPAGGATGNDAAGLEPAVGGQSGIQGLKSVFVRSADTYVFAPGELAPGRLRVLAVSLTSGAAWRNP